MEKLLTYNPKARIKAEDAIRVRNCLFLFFRGTKEKAWKCTQQEAGFKQGM